MINIFHNSKALLKSILFAPIRIKILVPLSQNRKNVLLFEQWVFQKKSSKSILQVKKLLHYSFTLLLEDRDVCCPIFLLNLNKPEKQSVLESSLKQKHPDQAQHVTYQSETFLCLRQGRIGSQSDTFIKVFHSLLNLVKQDFQLARMKENPISLFHLCFRHLHDNSISISYSSSVAELSRNLQNP